MTAPNIISFRPALSAVGVTGSPRPRAEFYSPWGMVPEHTPGTMGAEWIDAETERAARHAAAARQMAIARQTDAAAQSYNPARMPASDRLLWALVIVAIAMSAGVLALLIAENWRMV